MEMKNTCCMFKCGLFYMKLNNSMSIINEKYFVLIKQPVQNIKQKMKDVVINRKNMS